MSNFEHRIREKSIKTIYNEEGFLQEDQKSFLKNNFDIAILVNQLYNENNILTLKEKVSLDLFPIKNKLYNIKDNLIFNLCKQEPAAFTLYNKKYNYIRINTIVTCRKDYNLVGYKRVDKFTHPCISSGIICTKKFKMDHIFNNVLKKEIVNFKLAKTTEYLGARRLVGYIDLFYHIHYSNIIELKENSNYHIIYNEEDLMDLLKIDTLECKLAVDIMEPKIDKQKKLQYNLKNLKEIEKE